MEQEPSPEEILLRLIKGGKPAKTSPGVPAQKPEAAKEPAKGVGPEAQTPLSPLQQAKSGWPARLLRRFSSRKDGDGTEPQSEQPGRHVFSPLIGMQSRLTSLREDYFNDLHWISQAFLLLSVGMAGIIVFNVARDRADVHQKLDRIWSAGARPARSDARPAALYTPAANAEPLPDKDLFKSLEQPPPNSVSGPAPARVASLDQILSNYNLAGIIGGPQPQAIIEDKRQGKTFFLNVGDMLGEIRIVAIKEGKVVIAIGSEQAELDL